MKGLKLFTSTAIASLLLVLGISLVYSPNHVSALSGGDFQAGRIIDDSLYFDGGGLSAENIQAFLNAKVPTCDTSGTQMRGGVTRAAYASSIGYPGPFTCLKDFRQTTSARPAEAGLCDGYTVQNQSAAEIIYWVAKSCGVNPRALIVLLQKEQGLITDDWPLSVQYRSATGFGCPDTAPCDAEYYGFFNQVYSAARQFKYYAKSPSVFNYRASRNNNIQFNPSTDCGSSSIYIQGNATAGLYNYTPYQPNGAALGNLYGTGDSCSAYGNRNFWRYYNDWFGSPLLFNGTILVTSPLSISNTGPLYNGDTVTASYTVSNSASYAVSVGGLGICARLNGANYDIGFRDHVDIAANASTTITYSKTLDSGGSLKLFICSYNDAIGWASDRYPGSQNSSIVRELTQPVYENPVVTSGLSFSPANPSVGTPVTATMSVRNFSASPVTIGLQVAAGRDPNGNNVDFPADSPVTIAPNSTYTYSKTRSFTSGGNYSFFAANWSSNRWNTLYPKSIDGTIVRQANLSVRDSPLITSGVSVTPTNPAAGQNTTASFTLTNTSTVPINVGLAVVAGRDPNGNNVDFPADTNVSVSAGGTYTYSKTRTFASAGTYNFFIANQRSSAWAMDYPKSASDNTARRANINVYDNPLVISGISLSPASPVAGQAVTASLSIRNNGSTDVPIGLIVVAGRSASGGNVDFPADPNVTIAAGTTYTYSQSRTFPSSGNYTFFIANQRGSIWDMNYPKSAQSDIVRRLSKQVQ